MCSHWSITFIISSLIRAWVTARWQCMAQFQLNSVLTCLIVNILLPGWCTICFVLCIAANITVFSPVPAMISVLWFHSNTRFKFSDWQCNICMKCYLASLSIFAVINSPLLIECLAQSITQHLITYLSTHKLPYPVLSISRVNYFFRAGCMFNCSFKYSYIRVSRFGGF